MYIYICVCVCVIVFMLGNSPCRIDFMLGLYIASNNII